jgi:hypothetical protein
MFPPCPKKGLWRSLSEKSIRWLPSLVKKVKNNNKYSGTWPERISFYSHEAIINGPLKFAIDMRSGFEQQK